jgi:glutamate-1-semialdehyde 2,1-aminomutase
MTAKQKIFVRANRRIPGGVNSPVRAWKSVGGVPLFIGRGKGSYIFDAGGKRYVDFVGSWGPLILGHAHPQIVRAVQRRALQGFTFGAPTILEVELAEAVAAAMPSIEKLRLVSSGTEATMSAIRLARAFTGRNKIVKFDGCYHGHADGLLVKAGSGIATLSLPESAGVPRAFAGETLTAKYNDNQSVQRIFARYKNDIAAIIVEPICGNMGVIKPRPDFLNSLRQISHANGALLIFDEVITGFRVAYGGAQGLYKVRPDLTCLGKILGGGLPLAAFGGRSEIMDLLAPVGPVYQAGTLSGNPLAVAAGLTTIRLLSRPATYEKLEARGAYLEEGMRKVITHSRIEATINRVGSMMTIFFGVNRVSRPDEARNCDRSKFGKFFHAMLERGVYLPPAPFESMFISLTHSKDDLAKFLKAFDQWARRAAG